MRRTLLSDQDLHSWRIGRSRFEVRLMSAFPTSSRLHHPNFRSRHGFQALSQAPHLCIANFFFSPSLPAATLYLSSQLRRVSLCFQPSARNHLTRARSLSSELYPPHSARNSIHQNDERSDPDLHVIFTLRRAIDHSRDGRVCLTATCPPTPLRPFNHTP